METFFQTLGQIVVIALLLSMIIKDKRKKHWNEFEARMNTKTDTTIEQPYMRGLMLNTLTQIGCQPTDNQNEAISVQYQGENFNISFGGKYCRVGSQIWSGIKADVPDLQQVREAVNAANFNFGPITITVWPSPNNEFRTIHIYQDIMLHPPCPDNVPLVKGVLDSFIDVKENVRKLSTTQRPTTAGKETTSCRIMVYHWDPNKSDA